MLKNLYTTLIAAAAAMLSFSGLARAGNLVDPQDGSTDVAKAVYDAFANGHKAYAAALSLVIVVALVRKYLGGRWRFLHTDIGSTLLVLAGSFGTALAASLAGGGPATAHAAWSALVVAFGAAGGYTAVKKVIIEPLAPYLPESIRGVVLWLFEHASDVQVSVTDGNTPAPSDAGN